MQMRRTAARQAQSRQAPACQLNLQPPAAEHLLTATAQHRAPLQGPPMEDHQSVISAGCHGLRADLQIPAMRARRAKG